MTVKVFRPAIEVSLFKMVKRRAGIASRYAESSRKIDLTPYLGDNSSVRTLKSLYEGAGGFTLTFADQPYSETLDTVEAMIEPMDMIEIRAAREPWRYAGAPLPLVMRGWVTSVERPLGLGHDGTPQRSVIVGGQDSGKLWMIHQIFFEVAYLQETPFLDLFRMQAETGMDVAMLPVSEFITQLTDRIVNEKVHGMAAFSQQLVRRFRVNATVTEGTASANVAANVQGTIWEIAELFADRPWNELFIEDEEEGPVVRFRPCPARDIEGNFIMAGAADPGTVEVDYAAIENLRLRRSDSQVANFFVVPPGSSMLESGGLVNVAFLQSGEPLDDGYGNNDPNLYGRRRMQMPTRLLPDNLNTLPIMQPDESRRVAAARDVRFWHQRRAADLKSLNRDNVVFQDGTARLRGSEELKIGRYLRVTEASKATLEAYMTRVAHHITPFQSWKTDVALDRGTGFLERTKRTTSSFFAETANGPYR